jgi:hypothetical protein
MKNNKYAIRISLRTFFQKKCKKAILFLLSSFGVITLFSCSSVKAQESNEEICNSISKKYSMFQNSDEIKLQSFIKNNSNKTIEFVPDEFNSALYLSAVVLENSEKIPVFIPMAGVPMPVVLAPLETYKDEISLNSIIPNLNEILKEHSVRITWSNSFEADEFCFSAQNKYSMIIEKIE